MAERLNAHAWKACVAKNHRRFESSRFRMPKVELTNGQTIDVPDWTTDELVDQVVKQPYFISRGHTYFSKHVVEVIPDEPVGQKPPKPRPRRKD